MINTVNNYFVLSNTFVDHTSISGADNCECTFVPYMTTICTYIMMLCALLRYYRNTGTWCDLMRVVIPVSPQPRRYQYVSTSVQRRSTIQHPQTPNNYPGVLPSARERVTPELLGTWYWYMFPQRTSNVQNIYYYYYYRIILPTVFLGSRYILRSMHEYAEEPRSPGGNMVISDDIVANRAFIGHSLSMISCWFDV